MIKIKLLSYMIAVFINKYKCLKKITSQLNNINIYIWRYSIMAHLGNTVINGALRVLGGEYVDTINGVTVGSSPKFTDTTYSSKTAASGGTDVSLVTTGEKYTWNNKSNLTIGTTASTAAAGNHTHTVTIAADSGTSALNMAANTTYKITAGGSTFIFKTPVDNNTNNAVTQTATTTSANYEVLFSATADNTTRTEGARKNSNLTFNPSTGNLTVTQLNGVTVGSSPKFTDTTYSSQAAASGGTAVSLVTTGEKYTWNNKSNLAIGTTASTAAAGNHTHGISIATDSGTNQLTMAANTKYKITAGGSSYIFTTPVDNNTTYSSKAAASGGTDVSLCTTGEKYTWNNKSNLAIGTTSSTAAAGNHTHGISIAADSGTNQLTMAANTKYKITAGGSSYIFTTPPDNNTNNAVTQTATSTSADYEVLFSATADNTTRTEGARKNSNLKFNPSTGNLTVTKINGVTTTISGAVSAAVGDTSCTISNSAITTTSMLEPFASNSSGNIVSITNMTASAGSVKIYFPALTEATSFKVRISN